MACNGPSQLDLMMMMMIYQLHKHFFIPYKFCSMQILCFFIRHRHHDLNCSIDGIAKKIPGGELGIKETKVSQFYLLTISQRLKIREKDLMV
jgi:hypothetical protein